MRFARRPNIARSSTDRQNHQRRVTFDCAEECAIVSYNLPGCRKVRVAGLCSNPQVPEYLSERNPATCTVSTYSKPPGSARRIFLSGEECCGGGAGCRPYHPLRSCFHGTIQSKRPSHSHFLTVDLKRRGVALDYKHAVSSFLLPDILLDTEHRLQVKHDAPCHYEYFTPYRLGCSLSHPSCS